MKDTNIEHLAVLIDAENISHHRIKAIMEDIAGIGDVLAKRIYGDFSAQNNQPWIDCMKDLAIVPVFQPSYTFGKNSSDIALVIDAMDLLYTGRYDGFCLVTSDSDFTRLASRIREQGVKVYGYGRSYTNMAFRKACDKFTDIELLDNEVVSKQPEVKEEEPHDNQKVEVVNSTQTQIVGQTPVVAETPTVADMPLITQTQITTQTVKPKKINGLIAVIDKAIYLSCEEGNDTPLLSKVGMTLRRMIPDFNPKEYGFTKLTDLVGSSPRYQLIGTGGSVKIKIIYKAQKIK
jgi:hypothetical protein